MNLLVTGGCGFIGSHFVNYMFDNYNDITIINVDVMYYCANETNVSEKVRTSDRYKLVKANICSYDTMLAVLKDNKITHIVHFAAQSHVQNSFNDSLRYTQDNIVGTHTLLECSRIYGDIKRFVHVSTDEVYGESLNNESAKTEQSVLCPTNPYASTKAGAELIVQSYFHSYKMPIIITRGNNVYGPNQYPEKLIPKFIQLLQNNKPVTIQGDGSCKRAFLHVDDVVRAFDVVLMKGNVGEIYNIGSDADSEHTVLDIAKLLIKFIHGVDTDINKFITFIEDRPFNDKRYYISNDKMKKLGWSINVNFMKGLRELTL